MQVAHGQPAKRPEAHKAPLVVIRGEQPHGIHMRREQHALARAFFMHEQVAERIGRDLIGKRTRKLRNARRKLRLAAGGRRDRRKLRQQV